MTGGTQIFIERFSMPQPKHLPLVAHIRTATEHIEAYVESVQGPFSTFFSADVRNDSESYIAIAEVDSEGRRGESLYHVRPVYGANPPRYWKVCDPEDGQPCHSEGELTLQEAGQRLAFLLRQEGGLRGLQAPQIDNDW
jgi:hypothetical protein